MPIKGVMVKLQKIGNDPRFEAVVELTVPFHDLDPMQVVWHGNYFRYLEIAREALLNQFDYGYRQMHASGYMWPVVDAQIKYRAALTFEQHIRIRALLLEYENRLRIGYEICDAQSGKKLTTAYTVQVAVDAQTKELCFVCPEVLLQKIDSITSGVNQSAGSA